MGLFRRNKQEVVIDDRTELEKKFEETGQKVGKKTGVVVQKTLNKASELKEKHQLDDKMKQVKKLASKAEDKLDEVVDTLTQKGKEVYQKVSKGKTE